MLSATKIYGLNDLLLVVLYLTANMSPLLKATKFINITRAGQVRKLVRKSANPQLRTNEKSCGHADLRTLAV